MQKVLFFGDPGIDDSLAIIYGLLHPQLEIVGLVTSYGNVTQEQTTRNALYLLQLAGRQDIPVISGATMPFTDEYTAFYPEIHGAEGLGPIRPPDNVTGPVYNFGSIASLVSHYGSDLVIVDVGRSTSLAIALNLWKDLMRQVKGFYVMGGVFLQPGNVTPVAEANAHGDAIASRLVTRNAENLTMLPLNVTNKAILMPEVVDYIVNYTNAPFKSLIKPIFDYYFAAYKKLNPGIQGTPLHDVLALSAVVNPGFLQYAYRDVTVDISDRSKGETVADFRPSAKPGRVRIALELNQEAFLQDFVSVMTGQLK